MNAILYTVLQDLAVAPPVDIVPRLESRSKLRDNSLD